MSECYGVSEKLLPQCAPDVARITFRGRQACETCLELKMTNLEETANTDDLTKIGNRRSARLKFETLRESGGSFAVGVIDLDSFKRVNDIFGHGKGDEILVSTAQMMETSVKDLRIREDDDVSVARLGGDEFIVMLKPSRDNYPADTQLEGLLHRLNEQYKQTDVVLQVNTSATAASEKLGMKYKAGICNGESYEEIIESLGAKHEYTRSSAQAPQVPPPIDSL